MSPGPINSNFDSSVNENRPSSGQYSNEYVKKLLDEKLMVLRQQLQNMRESENNKSVIDFTKLKIEQLTKLMQFTDINKEMQNRSQNFT